MLLIGLFFFYVISDSALCWNLTDSYLSMDEGDLRSRKSKLFSFNTLDEEITLELNFAVPFIKIPVKKTMDTAKGSMANINVGALLLTGVITAGAMLVVPALLSILNTKLVPHSVLESHSYSPYRTADASDMWRYMAILDNALMGINIDTTSCMQRTLCSTVKNSSKNVNNGHGSSVDKIIDGLASNELLQKLFSHTPFFSAIRSGLDEIDCGKEYDKCTLSKRTLNMIIQKFVTMINGDS